MEKQNFNDDLSRIRQMMERSSRFISLSGLSGVFAGLTALVGAFYVYFLFQKNGIDYFNGENLSFSRALVRQLMVAGIVILLVAVAFGYFFTAQKSRKKGLKIWDATTRRLLINFTIPLIAGGIFCLAMIYHQLFVFVAPATLIFYGLALVNASKYTFSDVQYLGCLEIVLGLVSTFFLGCGLLFWAIGFGVLHIVYGLIMHKKYK